MSTRAPVKLPKHECSDPDKLSKKRTVDSAPSRKSRAGYTAKVQGPDRAAERPPPSTPDREQPSEEGARQRNARKEAAGVSAGSDDRKGSGARRAVAAQAVAAASQGAPPGFDTVCQEAEERRRPGIGLIRSLISPHTAPVPLPDKASAPQAKAARGTPGAEPMTPSGAPGVNPSRRERKGRRVEANGVASSDAPARDVAHLQASASGKKAVGGDTRPSNSAAQPDVPPSSKQRKGARRAQDRSSANGGPPAAKEASSDALSGRPPGLGPAEAGGTAAPKGQAGEKNGGGHNGVSRALGRALAPAYFERPAKQQQPRGGAAIQGIGRETHT